jgi:hypothetical protein
MDLPFCSQMKITRRARTHAAKSALFAILAQVLRKAKYARTPVVGQLDVEAAEPVPI